MEESSTHAAATKALFAAVGKNKPPDTCRWVTFDDIRSKHGYSSLGKALQLARRSNNAMVLLPEKDHVQAGTTLLRDGSSSDRFRSSEQTDYNLYTAMGKGDKPAYKFMRYSVAVVSTKGRRGRTLRQHKLTTPIHPDDTGAAGGRAVSFIRWGSDMDVALGGEGSTGIDDKDSSDDDEDGGGSGCSSSSNSSSGGGGGGSNREAMMERYYNYLHTQQPIPPAVARFVHAQWKKAEGEKRELQEKLDKLASSPVDRVRACCWAFHCCVCE